MIGTHVDLSKVVHILHEDGALENVLLPRQNPNECEVSILLLTTMLAKGGCDLPKAQNQQP